MKESVEYVCERRWKIPVRRGFFGLCVFNSRWQIWRCMKSLETHVILSFSFLSSLHVYSLHFFPSYFVMLLPYAEIIKNLIFPQLSCLDHLEIQRRETEFLDNFVNLLKRKT